MTLFDQVSEDIKKAMLAKDKVALDALRGIKKEFLEAKTAPGSDGELKDEKALQILQKLVKQRKAPNWQKKRWLSVRSLSSTCPLCSVKKN